VKNPHGTLKVAQEPEFKATWSWLKEVGSQYLGLKTRCGKRGRNFTHLTFDGGKPSEYIAKTLTLHTEMSEAPMAEVDRVYLVLEELASRCPAASELNLTRHDTGRWESLQELIDYIKPKFADVNYPYPNEKTDSHMRCRLAKGG
jgi:hypothetical protein